MSVVQGDEDEGAVALDSPRLEPERPADAAPHMDRVPALDGLRGLAVVAVLLFHGGYLTGGWLGVDLFFVLSGYLITTLLMIEHRQNGSIGLAAFWGRRARRLLPALLVVVLAVSFYAWQDVAPVDLGAVRSDGLATLFFVANWHDILNGVSYWDRGLAPSMFAHTWSLAVEEQLYLVWPIAVGLVLRRRPAKPAAVVARWALIAAAASATIAIGLRITGASEARIYLGTDTRAVAVALGAFVAAWRRRRPLTEAMVRLVQRAGIAAGAVLAVAWWGLDGKAAFTYWGGMLGASVLGAVVVAAAADVRSTGMARVLGVAPLRALGLLSYGLYLWHWPIYVVLSESRTDLDGLALLFLRLGVTLAVAAASWFLLERPIRLKRPAGWWVGPRGAASAVAGMAFATMALLAATLGAVALPTKALATGVDRPVAPLDGAPKVLVLGDSVAASIAAPAIEDPKAFGLNVVRSTVLGCQAVWDGVHRARGIEGDESTPPACPAGVAHLVADERPDAVLVLYGGWVDADLEVNGRWVDACNDQYLDLLRTRFTEVLTAARISGTPVYVANAPRSTNTFRGDDSWDHTDCTNEVMEEVATATDGVEVIDLDGWLCPDQECRVRVEGVPFRSDGVHFQGPGGAVASHWVLAEVADRAGLDALERVTTGQETPEYRATQTVCRSFGELDAISGGQLAEVVGSAESRQQFADSLADLNDDTLADLPPELAAQLEPLTDPVFQTWAISAVERLSKGEMPSPTELPPGTLDGVGTAMEALRKVC